MSQLLYAVNMLNVKLWSSGSVPGISMTVSPVNRYDPCSEWYINDTDPMV